MTRTEPYLIAIIALDHCLASTIAGALDMFQATNAIASALNPTQGPLFEFRVVSETGKPTATFNGYPQMVDCSWDSLKGVDLIFLPGVGIIDEDRLQQMIANNQSLKQWLRKMAARNCIFISNCTGSLFLAEAGLLDGKPATTAWPLSKYFTSHYPQVDLKPDALLTKSGNIICSGSAMAYQELVLHIIERTAGAKLARLCGRYLLVDGDRHSQAAYRVLTQVEGVDPLIDRATSFIRKHYRETLSVTDLADALNVSSRTVIRKFKQHTGNTPKRFIQQHRIEIAKELLVSTQLPLEKITQRIGYQDSSSFQRLFKRTTGLSASNYRKKFTRQQAAITQEI
jgi:transcriptional regulator GlxA family with amidase domain